jgi:hypothetical protein
LIGSSSLKEDSAGKAEDSAKSRLTERESLLVSPSRAAAAEAKASKLRPDQGLLENGLSVDLD